MDRTKAARVASRLSRRLHVAWKRIAGSTTQDAALVGLSDEERRLIARIHAHNLTYLSDKRLASLARTCRAIEEANVPGCFLEAGCALGGSAILMASLKRHERPLFIYDVFGMIPPPTGEDTPDVHSRYRAIAAGKSKGLGGNTYYGYVPNLYAVVQANLQRFGVDLEKHSVSLIKGLVQETMTIEQPVAFAHVDVDWYEPVMTCLTRVFPKLVLGGAMILDDYHDWGGCRKAVDEYVRSVDGEYLLDDSGGSMKLTRIKL